MTRKRLTVDHTNRHVTRRELELGSALRKAKAEIKRLKTIADGQYGLRPKPETRV